MKENIINTCITIQSNQHCGVSTVWRRRRRRKINTAYILAKCKTACIAASIVLHSSFFPAPCLPTDSVNNKPNIINDCKCKISKKKHKYVYIKIKSLSLVYIWKIADLSTFILQCCKLILWKVEWKWI